VQSQVGFVPAGPYSPIHRGFFVNCQEPDFESGVV